MVVVNRTASSVDAPGAMIKMVFMLKRRPGMSRADFIQYYESHHARLGEKYVPNAVRYVRRSHRACARPAPRVRRLGPSRWCGRKHCGRVRLTWA